MRYLRVKNWEEFQHYKDRNPAWIKLHVALLDDYEFSHLSDVNKAHLMLLWLFASRREGTVPNDPKFLQGKLGLDKQPDLEALAEAGFLIPDDGNAESRIKWASRYVSDELRSTVLEKAGRKCQCCGSKKDLEIDHILPISKGGDGEESNLQALCRSCNRKKRMRSKGYADAEQLATQTTSSSVALAHSREERREEAEENTLRFGRFWTSYPRKVSKPDALKAWKKLTLTFEQFEALMARLEQWKASERWGGENGRFIPHPATWLNKRNFEDEVPGAALRLASAPALGDCPCGSAATMKVGGQPRCAAHARGLAEAA